MRLVTFEPPCPLAGFALAQMLPSIQIPAGKLWSSWHFLCQKRPIPGGNVCAGGISTCDFAPAAL
jgi:hypothetical protein